MRFIKTFSLTFGLMAMFVPFAAQAAFPDVFPGRNDVQAIEYVQEKGIVQGYSNGDYRPSETISRAEFIKILVASQYSPEEIASCELGIFSPFPDVPKTEWYAPFICLAHKKDIVSGYSNGTFAPNNKVNFSNGLNFAEATTDDAVRTALQPFPKKEWVRIDAMMKPYVHTKNEIVHETAGFNSLNFWESFLQVESEISPIEKYIQDLQASTGKSINNVAYQSTIVGEQKTYDILPATLPYALVEGAIDQTPIVTEAWSSLPNIRRSKVKITLKNDANSGVVLEREFFGNEVNNLPVKLAYEGASATDNSVIESYEGIFATPADLFDPKTKYAHEVKAWANDVSYSGSVKQQIQKDIELMNTLGPENYKPIWHFVDSGPTGQFVDGIANGGLLKELEDAGIEYVIYK